MKILFLLLLLLNPAAFAIGRGCDPLHPLPPALQCGRAGDNPTFTEGVDCWVEICAATLKHYSESGMVLTTKDGKPIPGTVAKTDWVLRFTPRRPLDRDTDYVLQINPERIRSSSGETLSVTNGLKKGKAFQFCFRGGESPENRNASKKSGCE